MTARRNSFALAAPTIGVAALVLATLVAVIGSAQAAPSTKSYTANVRLTNAATSPSVFTLELTNDQKSKQPLGSAEFTAPPNFAVPAAAPQVVTVNGNTWTIRTSGSRVVQFNANSNGDALLPSERMVASVTVAVPSSCGDALWRAQAKQSNDFSGQPGNDFIQSSASDLIPLGSFDIAPIVTVKDGQTIPAILTEVPHRSTTTAKDTCGNTKTNYSGATRTSTLDPLETGYSPQTGLTWTGGVGTVFITPGITETGMTMTVRDATTGVSDTSDPFDTTDRLCLPNDVEDCEWKGQGGKITATSEAPPTGANLGIGFNSKLPFSCAGSSTSAGGAVVNINPRYDGADPPVGAIAVTLTYAKSETPGSANNYDVCYRKESETEWTVLDPCSSTSPDPGEAACFISRKRVSGGDLEVVLWVPTVDPWTGLG